MSKRIWVIAGLAVAGAAGWGMPVVAVAQEPDQKLSKVAPHRAGLPQLTPPGGRIHITSTVQGAAALAKAFAAPGPLLYHGGPIMQTATLYAIFWLPPALQERRTNEHSPALRASEHQPLGGLSVSRDR
jgi:hypothetical protein